MRAVVASNRKPTLIDLSPPSPDANEVLVRVKATALNRADLLQVQGLYPPPGGAPEILGLEFSGEIIDAGDAVKDFQVGQRVMALVAGGGYAEQAVVSAAHIMPIPDHLTYEQAAAIPEAFLTAYSNTVEIGKLTTGETVLIHAGASGVGLAAIQIAKVIGARVAVTASAPKHAICRECGADITIDYRMHNFADRLLADDVGIDLIIEHIGAPYWDDNVRVLNPWGRLVFIGLLGGAIKEVNFGDIMRKRLSIMGSTLRNRSDDEKAGLIARFWAWAQPHFMLGALKPVVWQSFPLEAVEEAHQLMASSSNAGKIVLTL